MRGLNNRQTTIQRIRMIKRQTQARLPDAYLRAMQKGGRRVPLSRRDAK